jgi:hypothetical protein
VQQANHREVFLLPTSICCCLLHQTCELVGTTAVRTPDCACPMAMAMALTMALTCQMLRRFPWPCSMPLVVLGTRSPRSGKRTTRFPQLSQPPNEGNSQELSPTRAAAKSAASLPPLRAGAAPAPAGTPRQGTPPPPYKYAPLRTLERPHRPPRHPSPHQQSN